MTTYNLGPIDRIIRAILGFALIYVSLYAPLSAPWMWTAALLGIAFLVSGMSGFCPAYRALGIRSCGKC